MACKSSEGWHELEIKPRRECPKLFYSFSLADNGFMLLLTDLMAIWQCALDRYDIHAEASRQHCPIDPSESTQQLKVLLSKLQQSLHDGGNFLALNSGTKVQELVLETTIKLPMPLRPLEWAFKLVPQSASELAEHILRPSLHEVSVSQNKIDSLQRLLKEKDHVISRLLERTGSSGADLSLIFPGITGLAPRKSHFTVSEAMKHVPGMAPFDDKTWTKNFTNDDDYEGVGRAGLGNLVVGCEKCFIHTRAEHDDWVKSLPDPGRLRSARDSKQKEAKTVEPLEEETGDESTASEDAFERRATPPSLKKKQPSPAWAVSTDRVEDEGQPPPSKRAKTGRIGALGLRNASTKPKVITQHWSSSPDHIQTFSPSPKNIIPQDSVSTEASSDSDLDAKPQTRVKHKPSVSPRSAPGRVSTSSPALATSEASSPPSNSLGRLRQRTKTHSSEPTPSSESQHENKATSTRRLGRLGARKQQSQYKSQSQSQNRAQPGNSDAEAAPSIRTRSKPIGDDSDNATASTSSASTSSPAPSKTNRPAATPSPRPPKTAPEAKQETETAEQAANRRREELKRSITAGAGAKKKRRF